MHGLMAEFASPEALVEAARAARRAGYRPDAYSPFEIEQLTEVLGLDKSRIPLATLLGGIAGGVGGYFMEWYAAVVDRPIHVGGRPLHSWPMFVPVAFELTILCAALAAIVTFVIGARLPKLRHPIFDAPDFEFATRNRFFLVLRADDPAFEAQAASRWLADQSPLKRSEVPG